MGGEGVDPVNGVVDSVDAVVPGVVDSVVAVLGVGVVSVSVETSVDDEVAAP